MSFVQNLKIGGVTEECKECGNMMSHCECEQEGEEQAVYIDGTTEIRNVAS